MENQLQLCEEDEIKDYLFKIDLLKKKLDNNFIFITDYQIYNNILNLKDYSPVKILAY